MGSPMNPSKKEPYPNVELRYEDNFDLVSVVEVVANPTTKSSMKDFGSVSDFLKTMQEDGFFGEQTWYGSTKSEGGFTANTVSVVNVISLDKTEKDGKEYYKYHLLAGAAALVAAPPAHLGHCGRRQGVALQGGGGGQALLQGRGQVRRGHLGLVHRVGLRWARAVGVGGDLDLHNSTECESEMCFAERKSLAAQSGACSRKKLSLPAKRADVL